MAAGSARRTCRTRSATPSSRGSVGCRRTPQTDRPRRRGRRSLLQPATSWPAWSIARSGARADDRRSSSMPRSSTPSTTSTDGYYDFRHQLLRDAIYGSVPPSQLRRFHAQAAEFVMDARGVERRPRVAPLRAGGPPGPGVPGVDDRRPRGKPDLRPPGGLRAAPAGHRQHAGRPAGRRARRAVPGVLQRGRCDRADRRHAAGGARGAAVVPRGRPDRRRGRAPHRHREWRPSDGRAARATPGVRSTRASPSSRASAPGKARDVAMASLVSFQSLDEFDAVELRGARERLRGPRRSRRQAVGDEEIDARRRASSRPRSRWTATRMRHPRTDDPDLPRGARRRVRERRRHRLSDHGDMASRIMEYPVAEAAIAEGVEYADAIEQSHCRQQMATTSALIAWAARRVGYRIDDAPARSSPSGAAGAARSARCP